VLETSGASGMGGGSVGFSVLANTSSAPRSGTLAIAGLQFTVNQAGGNAVAVTSDSVSPSSGSGASQTFTLTYSDTNGAADLAYVQAAFNSTLSGVAACDVYVVPASGAIYLANAAYSAWSLPLTLGSAGTLQNSQCAINVGASSGVLSGNIYTLKLAITFQSGFTGAKNLYGYASQTIGNLNSGWQTLGTWTP